MNLAVNELLQIESTDRMYRVLWIDTDNFQVVLIDINDTKALPFFRSITEIHDELVAGSIRKTKDAPLLFRPDEKHIAKRDEHWQMIREIVMKEPEIYDSEKRGLLMSQAMEKTGVSKPTLYKILRRYWQRGKSPDSLFPDYHKSGGKGKEKSAGDVKRGRPPIYGGDGINVDESIKTIFRVAIDKYYLSTKKTNLTAAYQMMIKEYFTEDIYFEDGREKVIIADRDKLPSLTQFKYWFKKEFSMQEVKIARYGKTNYEKDHRAVLGSSTFGVNGPGSRFQIDATVADVYLVSRYNREWIIGRPIVYLVIDVFSRMVVGSYVGLEGPSWMGAMMALANTASDKQVFCSQYGIPISKSDWPCEHLPEILLADRGELEGYNVERLISAFQLHVENTPPYRADWKGIVEQKFRTTQMKVKPFLPGYVEKDFQVRGARDYRLDAKLTLEEFTKVIIWQIITYNKTHYLSQYVRDEEMIQDDVNPVPIELWEWGIVHRSGKLRYFQESLVRMHLLPQEEALVTYRGIKFKRMLYGSEIAVREGWFPKARDKSWKITVSYDPRNVSQIYYWNRQNGLFEDLFLLDHQNRYMNKSLDEVNHLIAYEKLQQKNAEHSQLQADVGFMTNVEQIVKDAEKAVNSEKTESISKSQRIKNIKIHRHIEKNERRAEESFSKPIKGETTAEVIPINLHQDEESFRRPTIKEFLKKSKEHKDNE